MGVERLLGSLDLGNHGRIRLGDLVEVVDVRAQLLKGGRAHDHVEEAVAARFIGGRDAIGEHFLFCVQILLFGIDVGLGVVDLALRGIDLALHRLDLREGVGLLLRERLVFLAYLVELGFDLVVLGLRIVKRTLGVVEIGPVNRQQGHRHKRLSRGEGAAGKKNPERRAAREFGIDEGRRRIAPARVLRIQA